MVHSIHVSRHTVYWVQAQVGFGRVYFPGPNRVGARAHFMRWAQPILRLLRRACARANDGLASVNAGQPLMKNLSHFVKSVLYRPTFRYTVMQNQTAAIGYVSSNSLLLFVLAREKNRLFYSSQQYTCVNVLLLIIPMFIFSEYGGDGMAYLREYKVSSRIRQLLVGGLQAILYRSGLYYCLL